MTAGAQPPTQHSSPPQAMRFPKAGTQDQNGLCSEWKREARFTKYAHASILNAEFVSQGLLGVCLSLRDKAQSTYLIQKEESTSPPSQLTAWQGRPVSVLFLILFVPSSHNHCLNFLFYFSSF